MGLRESAPSLQESQLKSTISLQSLAQLSTELDRLYQSYDRNQTGPYEPKDVGPRILNALNEMFSSQDMPRWGSELSTYFRRYFGDCIGPIWYKEKEHFYQQMLTIFGVDRKPNYSAQGQLTNYLKQNTQQVEEVSVANLNQSLLQTDEQIPFIILRNEKDQPDLRQLDNSSLLVPQVAFADRLNSDSQEKLDNELQFYKEFSKIVRKSLQSNFVLSAPLKHFEILFRFRINRKKLKKSKTLKQRTKAEVAKSEQILRHNNSILLREIRQFTEAYTDFVWKYLRLDSIVKGRLTSLLKKDTLYGIILGAVWVQNDWIGDRGCEYQWLREILVNDKTVKGLISQVSIQNETQKKLRYCLEQLRNELSPQRYLKKIVLFYRESTRGCECADDLLGVYLKLLVAIIEEGHHVQYRFFTMRAIIEELVKVGGSADNNGQSLNCGEIGYAWTTWQIAVRFLQDKAAETTKRFSKVDMSNSVSSVELMELDTSNPEIS